MSATASASSSKTLKRKAAAPIDTTAATAASAPSDKKAKSAAANLREQAHLIAAINTAIGPASVDNETLQEFPAKLTMKEASEVLVACMDHAQLLALVMAGHARHKTLQLTKKRHAELASGATLVAADVLRTLKSDATGHAQRHWNTFAPAKANPFTQKTAERAKAVKALADAKAKATRDGTAAGRTYPDPKTLIGKIFVKTGCWSGPTVVRVVNHTKKTAILDYIPREYVTRGEYHYRCDFSKVPPLTKALDVSPNTVDVSGVRIWQDAKDGSCGFSVKGDYFHEVEYTYLAKAHEAAIRAALCPATATATVALPEPALCGLIASFLEVESVFSTSWCEY